MPKTKSIYICQTCAFESTNWLGQCPSCQSWNSLVETVVATKKTYNTTTVYSNITPILLSEHKSQSLLDRLPSNIYEFDRVLGGGFVPGQVTLLSGEPGIGKSTLLLQLCKQLPDKRILYVSGEENLTQIKSRASRMNYSGTNLLLFTETNLDSILSTLEKLKEDIFLVIIDSIQTIYTSELAGMPGSVGQVRECTQKLTTTAKSLQIPMIIVGHVTKDGSVAGPKVLEHIIDTVLYLEGDSQHMYRILKTTKNRFGAISEAGFFEMVPEGMTEVSNPSSLFLSQAKEPAIGTCVSVTMEGFRPVLFEIQALIVKTSFGYPRRTANGFNVNRLLVLLATMQKIVNLDLSQYDVYLNIAGGFKVTEYAADLAVCLAIASSFKNKALKPTILAFGECSLTGEVRNVTYQDKRIKEAEKLGFSNAISPVTVKTLKKAFELAFN